MPPEGEDGYGRRSYGEPYPDAYGASYGERDEDEPYGRGSSSGAWSYESEQAGQTGHAGQPGPPGQGYAQQGYPDRDFQRAVDSLADPLSDPLPGQSPRRAPAQGYGEQQGQGYPGQGYVVESYGLQPEHGRQQPQQPQQPDRHQSQQQELQQDGVSPWFRTDRQPEQVWEDPRQDGRTQRLTTQRPQSPQSPQSPQTPQISQTPHHVQQAGPPQQPQRSQRPGRPGQPGQEYGTAPGGGQPPYGGQEQQGPEPTRRLRTQQNRQPQQWNAEAPGTGGQSGPGPGAGGAPLGDPGTAAGLPVRGQHRQVSGWHGAEGAGAGAGAGAGTAYTESPGPAPRGGRRRSPQVPDAEGAFTGDAHSGTAPLGAASPGAGARTGVDETTAMPAVEAPAPAPAPAPGRAARRKAAESSSASSPAAGAASSASATSAGTGTADDDAKTNTTTVGLVRPGEAALGGRAARRRAAQRRGRGGGPPPAAPGTRLEARRAERARRPGPAIIASRLLGEVFISTGVLMLLFVAYQLWWTNVLAGQEAGGAAQSLQDSWGESGKAGKGGLDPERRADDFKPGEGFAILYLPKLDVRVPVAQGTSKPAVLDKGLVGHYDGTPFRTGMPWDKTGNFALAGHRNTHGEPFRYINRLVGGDDIVVETATKFYTYKMTARLPSTSPSNTSVIRPVPTGSGFQKPGRYITLTTCTPEFTSKYRLIVWGKMVEERPRSKGKPDALVE